jgi:citrate lyase gamma subunit
MRPKEKVMKVYVVMEFYVNVEDQGGADELVKFTAEDLVKRARDQGETFNTDISEADDEVDDEVDDE